MDPGQLLAKGAPLHGSHPLHLRPCHAPREKMPAPPHGPALPAQLTVASVLQVTIRDKGHYPRQELSGLNALTSSMTLKVSEGLSVRIRAPTPDPEAPPGCPSGGSSPAPESRGRCFPRLQWQLEMWGHLKKPPWLCFQPRRS